MSHWDAFITIPAHPHEHPSPRCPAAGRGVIDPATAASDLPAATVAAALLHAVAVMVVSIRSAAPIPLLRKRPYLQEDESGQKQMFRVSGER